MNVGMGLELSLGMNGIKMLKEILTGLVMVGNVFLVAAVHMRHAEFEECMAHEAFVKEMQKAYNEVQSKTFEFQDFREKKPRPTAEEVIDQAVGKKGKDK